MKCRAKSDLPDPDGPTKSADAPGRNTAGHIAWRTRSVRSSPVPVLTIRLKQPPSV